MEEVRICSWTCSKIYFQKSSTIFFIISFLIYLLILFIKIFIYIIVYIYNPLQYPWSIIYFKLGILCIE